MFSEYPAILDLIHTVSIVQEIGILLLNKERNGVTEETGQITSVHGESPFPRPQLRMVFTALPYSVLKETGSNAEK